MGATRVAIGDRFVDIEVPEDFELDAAAPQLMLIDRADREHYLEMSVITVAPEDPEVRDAGARHVRGKGSPAPVIEIRGDLLARTERAELEDRSYEHWHVGFGNRLVLVTRSWPAARPALDAPAERDRVIEVIRSLRETHDALPPVKERAVIRELVASQQVWLDAVAARFASIVEGEITLEALDAYWARLLAEAPPGDAWPHDAIDELAVAFAAELQRSRHGFTWAVVTDAWGTTLAVVAYRGTADVVIDPFNFVAKRWETREAPFFVATGPRMIAELDRFAAT